MSATLWSSSTSIMLLLAISFSGNQAEPAEMKAVVSDTPTANLRAGAGVDQTLKLTLKEGDQVTVEKAEGEWFLVAAADGQKGYIHKNLLKLAGETLGQSVADQTPIRQVAAAQPKESAKDATAPAAVGPASQSQSVAPAKAGGSTKTTPPATPAGAAPQQASEAKSQSILQMIEGHEAEVKIAALVAAIAFVLGWFCGGSYYVRRERRARRKLRF
jgi:SH3-like domain-containing protein